MEVGQLYQFVLLLVLVGIVIGIGVVVLDKFGATTAAAGSTVASTAINATRTEIAGISSNWLGIIVIVVVAAIILGLVMSSFGQKR